MNNLETTSFQLRYVVKNNNAGPLFQTLRARQENYFCMNVVVNLVCNSFEFYTFMNTQLKLVNLRPNLFFCSSINTFQLYLSIVYFTQNNLLK